MDLYLGQILPWPGESPPMGWALCDGGLLRIDQHMALFALIGTRFGGDGVTTFGVPDLRGALKAANGGAVNHIMALTGDFPALDQRRP